MPASGARHLWARSTLHACSQLARTRSSMSRSGPDTFVKREYLCNFRQALGSTSPLFRINAAGRIASAHHSDTFGRLLAPRKTFSHRPLPQTHAAPLSMMLRVVGLSF